jgi:hypothetical protein
MQIVLGNLVFILYMAMGCQEGKNQAVQNNCHPLVSGTREGTQDFVFSVVSEICLC